MNHHFHVAAYGAGELVILHSPGSMKFSGWEQIDESMVKEIFAVCLGFSVTKVQYTVNARQVALHELTGECTRLHDVNLNLLYSLPCVCTMTQVDKFVMYVTCTQHEEWKWQCY